MTTDQQATELRRRLHAARVALRDAERVRDRALNVWLRHRRQRRASTLCVAAGIGLMLCAGTLTGLDGTVFPPDSMMGLSIACWVLGPAFTITGFVFFCVLFFTDAEYQRAAYGTVYQTRYDVYDDAKLEVRCALDAVTVAWTAASRVGVLDDVE